MHAHVTADSQPYRLKQELAHSHISHGDTVRVDIPRVRVAGYGEPVAFFCQMEPVRVKHRFVAGDGGGLPETVVLDGFEFPELGEYDLIDALVSANGDLRVVADEKTRIVPRAPSAMPAGEWSAASDRRAGGAWAHFGQFLSTHIW